MFSQISLDKKDVLENVDECYFSEDVLIIEEIQLS